MNIKNVNIYNNQISPGFFNNQIRKTSAPQTNIVFSNIQLTDTITFSPSSSYIANKYRGNERKLMMGYFKSATIEEISAFEETNALKYLNAFSGAVNEGDKNYVSALSDKYAELYDDIQNGAFETEDEKKQAIEILDKAYGFMAENVSEEVGDMADKELNAASNYLFKGVDAKRLNKVKSFSEFAKVFDKSAFVDYVKNLADSIKTRIKENGKTYTDEFIDKEATKNKSKSFEHMSAKELKHMGGYVFGNSDRENYEDCSGKFKNTFRKAKIQLNLAKNAEESLSIMEQRKKSLENIQKSMEESLKYYLQDENNEKTYPKENEVKPINLLINSSVKGLTNKLIKETGLGKEEADNLKKLLSNLNLHGAGEAYKRHLNTKIDETKKRIRAINRTDKTAVFDSSEAQHNIRLLNRINEQLKTE